MFLGRLEETGESGGIQARLNGRSQIACSGIFTVHKEQIMTVHALI